MGTHDCSENCNNTNGSFVCYCTDGYELEENEKSCRVLLQILLLYILLVNFSFIMFFLYIDIDECDLGTDDCAHNCSNTNGSFICFCRDGYAIELDGKSCGGWVKYAINTY